jgi:SEC-C motif
MKEKISRNEPCPCGSGKKYKKCCGAKEAVSITGMIETEIEALQKQILQFAAYYYGDDLQEDFADFEEHFIMQEEQEKKFYELMHAVWFILFEPLEDGDTILEKFITMEAGKISRPKLRGILRSWTEAKTFAGTVIDIENNKLTVENGLTSEVITAVIANQAFEMKKGYFIVGVILPYEQKYVFFPTAFELPELEPELGIGYIKDSSLEFGYESPSEYFTDFFLQILHDLPMLGAGNSIDTLEWPAPIYKEVAEIFQKELESRGESDLVVQTGVLLWSMFCQKKQKRIKNPAIYVAALDYLISSIAPVEMEYSQKELGEQYGVSAGTISSVYREMERELESELTDLMGMVYGADEVPSGPNRAPAQVLQFSSPHQQGPLATERFMQEALADIQEQNFENIEEINEFMNKRMNEPAVKKAPKGNKERAQQLIYDAFEAEGKERYELANAALTLNPNSSDAYVILAEVAESLEEATFLYKKGMMAGENELGKSFFKENKGHFWGLLETRPFMRAKAHYADAVYQLGMEFVARKQYEEILELNPMDNQGVRYSLFPIYMENGDLKKAEKLLEKYDEGAAHGLFNQLLLELSKNGITPRATKLLKDAKKENKHVINFLTGKKRLPKKLPDYYGMGDENEAIIYADAHLHLWKKINGIQDWLK